MLMDVAARVFLGWACVAGADEGLRGLVGEESLRSPEAARAQMQKELDRFWDSAAFPLSALKSELPPLQPLRELPDAQPPTKAEVMQAIAQSGWGLARREGLTYRTEKLTDKIGAARFFPLVGPAQLREVRWNCTATYDLVIEVGTEPKCRVVIPRRREVVVGTTELILRNLTKD